MTLIRDALAGARSALRGGPGPQVLPLEDRAPTVAFLVTLRRVHGDLVVPLHPGPNVVGRGVKGHEPNGEWPKPHAVEQSQWCIECGVSTAEVWDAYSTNLSVLLPAGRLGELDLEAITASRFMPDLELPGALQLPHPNEPADRHRYPLTEGDVLRSCYCAFAFGWLRSPLPG
jgi:hypothetical protein